MPPAKTSYSDLKVVDLKDLLKERGIMPKGNKADLVKLLEKADAKKKAKRDKKKAGGKVEKTNQKKTGGEGKKRRKEKEEVVEVEEEEEEEVEEEEEEVEVEVEVEKKKSRRRKKKPVEEEAKEVEDVEEDEEEVEDVEEDEEEVEDVEEAEEEEKTEQEDDAEEDEVEEAEEEGEPTPKRSFRKSKSPTEKEPTPAPSSNPSKKKIDVREAEVRSSRLEGLFGTMKEVSDKLCENRDLLEIFSLKTDEKFDALVESVFSAKTVDQMKKLVEEYASFGYDCKLKESHTGVYLDWLKDIAGKFQQILVIPKPESEPLFDSALGVYRIGDYAFTKDDGDETSSLVFGVISKNTVVPLTLKTIKECPAEYTLYHVYHQQDYPPNEEGIKKIIEDMTYPKLIRSEGDDDGLSYPNEWAGSEKEVPKELAEITVPEPTKETFNKYRASQRRLGTANYKLVAENAGISESDALYIASNMQKMQKKYRG